VRIFTCQSDYLYKLFVISKACINRENKKEEGKSVAIVMGYQLVTESREEKNGGAAPHIKSPDNVGLPMET
jgi:hypothetical protein